MTPSDQLLTTAASPSSAPTPVPDPVPAKRASAALCAALVFVIAVGASLLAYAALTLPGAWFPRDSPKAWAASDLALVRGTGQLAGEELVVTASGADNIALVRAPVDLRSSDYPAIVWVGVDFSDTATVSLLWRSDYAPERLNHAQVRVESGRPMPVVLAKDPAWIGRITGVALAIRGPLPQPIRIRGVVAKPMGLIETLHDRASEWLAFESWTGTSINTISGGADIQDLPLPLLLAAAVTGAVGIVALIRRLRASAFGMTTIELAAAFFLVAWLLLDARWMWNLTRQGAVTAKEFAFKTTDEKHSTEEDAALYAFVSQALKVLPAEPARVIVAADADYFRGRAAYHLYPHNVFFDPRSNVLLPARMLRPGDWLLVYRRRGILYDAAQQKLRWDGGETVSAEIKMAGAGAALFLIR